MTCYGSAYIEVHVSVGINNTADNNIELLRRHNLWQRLLYTPVIARLYFLRCSISIDAFFRRLELEKLFVDDKVLSLSRRLCIDLQIKAIIDVIARELSSGHSSQVLNIHFIGSTTAPEEQAELLLSSHLKAICGPR